jgi:DNA end-binding protein Ku
VIQLSRVVAIDAKKKQMKPSRAKSKAGEKQEPAAGNVVRIMSARRKPVEVENCSGRRQT